MGLQIKRAVGKKLYLIASFMAVFALAAQPMYGLVASQVANALTTVSDYTGLQTALAGSDTEINVSGTITVPANQTVTVNRSVTINGGTFIAGGPGVYGSTDAVIYVTGAATNFVMNNSVIDGNNVGTYSILWPSSSTARQGVKVYNGANVSLNNVTIKNNKKAGLHVNGTSKATVNNIVTANNGGSFGAMAVSGGGTITINGMSTHSSEGFGLYDIRIDGTGTLDDSNSQYTSGDYRKLKTAPLSPTITAPTEGQVFTVNSVNATWNPVSGNATTQAAVSYNYRVDNGPIQNTIATTATLSPLANGNHTLQVQAVSASGLTSDWSAVRNFTVNVDELPQATISSPVANSTVSTKKNGNKLTITGIYTDDRSVNYLQLQLVGNGVSIVNTMHHGINTTGGSFTHDMTVPADIADGDYTLYYTPSDYNPTTGGQFGPRGEIKFKIDNTAPTATATYSGGVQISGVRHIKNIADLSVTENIQDAGGVARSTFVVYKQNTAGAYEVYCGNWNADSKSNYNYDGSTSVTRTFNNVKDCEPVLQPWDSGKYQILHAAYDVAGNEIKYNYPGTEEFVIDQTAPSGSATYRGGVVVDGVRYIRSATELKYNANLADDKGLWQTSHVMFKIDESTGLRAKNPITGETYFCGNWTNSETSINISGLNASLTDKQVNNCYWRHGGSWSDGKYEIGHIVYDSVRNSTHFNTPNYRFILDSTKPIIANFQIDNLKPAYTTQIKVSASVTDANLKPNSVVFYLTEAESTNADGSPKCTGNGTKLITAVGELNATTDRYEATLNTAAFNGNDYCVSATAADLATNNAIPTGRAMVTIDNTRPTAEIVSPADNSIVTTLNGKELQLKASDATSGLEGFDVTLWAEGVARTPDTVADHMKYSWGAVVPESSKSEYGTTITLPSNLNLPDGKYTIYFTATDKAGLGGNADSVTITIDSTPPTVSVNEIASSTNREPTITGTATDENGSGVATVEIQINDGDWVEVEVDDVDKDGTWSYTPTYDLQPGSYTVIARAKDKAGNVSSSDQEGPANGAQNWRTFTIIAVSIPGVVVPTPEVQLPISPIGAPALLPTPALAPAPATVTPVSNPDVPTSSTSNSANQRTATPSNASENGEVLSAENTGKDWSVVNLLLTIITGVLSVIALAGAFAESSKKKLVRALTLVPALGSLATLLLIEDFTGAMSFVNIWTILLAGLTIMQSVIVSRTKTKTS